MKIQDFCKSVGEGGCLAMCYVAASFGPEITPAMMFDALWDAVENNILDVDDYCYVRDAVQLMRLVNPSKTYSVIKQKISSIEELKGQLAAVNFSRGRANHWVLVDNGEIIFDSLENSQCVKYGNITDARVILMEDR
jgi:ribosomal silencing factor RsfS